MSDNTAFAPLVAVKRIGAGKAHRPDGARTRCGVVVRGGVLVPLRDEAFADVCRVCWSGVVERTA